VLPAGNQEAQIAVTIKGDTKVEGNERFELRLSNFINAESAGNTYGIILNDD
jgi:hypothetical protein